ncbi:MULTISPECIES: ATP-grasp ribosomal peptide maturase [unclassified Streptomyces]|uniref:ATP-grasp ribosomal peptide maturase n=1 Tax=unclassified Streptomyces TaxID=2593676 RepID=UPI0022527C76|nr:MULTISPECIES: ATP-grasp ribosomal peptide maturase [unclassified Streptomyces]MCX5443786.1 ATP-grasp ribosomal peptide maturase [Streptomyces sp. NBC_00063]WUB90875.1 ATP-grasp ribosomal peptide maturase [Streptomyces sp. NBC_00569]WUB99164.1 ATP-grasp ribosomal peptide maturase [Streptomyces sp. NBC_00569]
MTAAARPVLVVAEQLDASADMVVDQLNQRDVPVIRFDAAAFPQQLTLTAAHADREAGWSGILDDGRRTARLEDVRAIYWRRPGRPLIADSVPEPYRTWAQNQADAALLNVLAALPGVPWINNPHADRLAAHKPQQLVAATRCGLTVPRSLVTNAPAAARDFAKQIDAPLICKPVLGGRLPIEEGRALMVATHHVDPLDFDDSIRLSAHYLQEAIAKAFEVRLVAVGDRVFGGTLHTTSAKAATDWRTDYEHIEYGTITVPDDIATAVRRFLAYYGIVFGSFDFAVTPAGQWVFFENNPAGTWAWVENRTALPIAAAHADYLQGVIE